MDSGPFLSNRPRDARWLAAVGAIILLIVQLHVGAAEGAEEPASGIDGSIRQDIRILLRNPPARSTSTYEGLLAAAGEHSVSRLEMTGCEVWTVSAGAADRLLMAAKGFKIPAATIGQEPSMVVQGMHSDARLDSAEKSLMAEAMRHPEAMGMMMAQTPNAAMTEYALTATDDTGAPAAVRLALTDEVTVEAIRQRLEKTAEGYVWHGVIAGTDEPVTLLWWPSGRLTGQVRYQNGIYSIRHFGRSIHGVVAISPRRLPPEHAPMPTAMMKKMKMDRDPFVREGSASQLLNAMDKSAKGLDKQRDRSRNEKQIITDLRASDTRISVRAEQPAGTVELTLLVAYTGRAARYYSNIRRDLIHLAIEEANASFVRSGISKLKIRLVHAYQTRYREMGTHFDHLFRFADSGDGIMEEVHRKRNRYKADMAVLIVDDSAGCGLAAGIAPTADRAFGVVHHGCAATSYSLAHEIGHILGARHDRALDEGGAPFPFGHGYVHGREWRTMMSYDESCGKCPRLPVWSNPDLTVRGALAGDRNSNNARAILERAANVAAFR